MGHKNNRAHAISSGPVFVSTSYITYNFMTNLLLPKKNRPVFVSTTYIHDQSLNCQKDRTKDKFLEASTHGHMV
jgi:hypothetical protein